MDDDDAYAEEDNYSQRPSRSAPLLLSPQPETKSQLSSGIRLQQPNPTRLEFAAPTATFEESSFRHSGWAAKRLKVFEALCRLNKPTRRLERFAECGARLRVEIRDDGKAARLVSEKCRDRTCVACGCDRAAVISDNLLQIMEAETSRFVVLTLRHSLSPLADQIDRLYDSFNKLRRRDFWKGCITGGAAFLEIKRSEKSGLWHPHLHLIVTGDFILQKRLSQEWLAVTGDSSYVYVNAVGDHLKVAKYVTKYVTKPLDSTCFQSSEILDEAICALGGRRLCLTFGTWRGQKLTQPKRDGHGWTSVGSAWSIWRRVRDGEDGAAADAAALVKLCPAFGSFMGMMFKVGPPPPVDECPF